MKRLLFFSILSIFCLTISAQTKTWVGPSGGSFNIASSWSPSGIPTSINDVIIPTGSNVVIDANASIKSLVMQGNAAVATSANITFTNASSIATNAIFNLSLGGFFGSGTLTNNGTFNITGNSSKAFGNSVNLLNTGTINFNGTGSLTLGYGSPTINNAASGVINLNSDSAFDYTQGVGTLINSGLIKRAQGSGLFTIYTQFQNNDGTISVEAGTFKLDYSNSILTDGTYNVTSGNTLEWANGFTLLGSLTGQLDGQINWTGNMGVNEGTEAILDFNGPTGVNWTSGSFGGNGTLTNMGILNLVSSTAKSVSGQSILNNEDTINFNGTGSLTLGFGSPTLNNDASGVINLNSDSAFDYQQGVGTVVNSGNIIKEQTTGTFNFYANTNNVSPGRIICEQGLLNFGTYTGNGLLGGNGIVQMPNSTLFEGTIAPGSSPGILTFVSNYNSSPATVLAIEINGTNAGADYDVFAIESNAAMDGTIDLALSYTANLNDEFVIVTSPNITSCNLPATVTAHFDNHDYTFDVNCNTTNVTLKVNNIVLGTQENNLRNIAMYPNPSNGIFTIDLGRDYTDVTVEIVNMLGQKISSEKYQSAKTIEQQINTAAGIYLVKISTANEGSKTLRIIKQ